MTSRASTRGGTHFENRHSQKIADFASITCGPHRRSRSCASIAGSTARRGAGITRPTMPRSLVNLGSETARPVNQCFESLSQKLTCLLVGKFPALVEFSDAVIDHH